MATCVRVGPWRRLGVLLVLALLASELVLADASGKKKKKMKKKKGAIKKNGAKQQPSVIGETLERGIGLNELDHLAYFEREIGRQLSGLDGTSVHTSSALPKPTSVVSPEALMAALLQAKMGVIGSSLIDAGGGLAKLPGVRAGESAASDGDGRTPELMVLGNNGWQPVAIGLVGNWTRHGFRCFGQAQQPKEPLSAGRDSANTTLAECQRACEELRGCGYYSHRAGAAADAADVGSSNEGSGRCDLYSAEPTQLLSQVVGGRPSAADKSEDVPEQHTTGALGHQSGGVESGFRVGLNVGALTQIDRCGVDLSGCSHPDAPDSTCLYTAGENTVSQRATVAHLQQLFGGQEIKPVGNANAAPQELALVAPMTQKERLVAALTHFGKLTKSFSAKQHSMRGTLALLCIG